MGKLTFSHVTNGINHEKVGWLPTCLHLLYPPTLSSYKRLLAGTCQESVHHSAAPENNSCKECWKHWSLTAKREMTELSFMKWFRPEQRKVWGRREWCEHPLWVPGARCLLPQILRKCPLFSSGLLSMKSPSVPFFSFRNPHFYQRMTMPVMQNNDARWQGPHSHQVNRLTKDLDNVFTVHAFNRRLVLMPTLTTVWSRVYRQSDLI